MGQTYTSTNPAAGATTIGELYQIVRDHFDAAITNMNGGSAPGSPAEGWTWYDSTNDVLKVYDGSTWSKVSESIATIVAKRKKYNMY